MLLLASPGAYLVIMPAFLVVLVFLVPALPGLLGLFGASKRRALSLVPGEGAADESE